MNDTDTTPPAPQKDAPAAAPPIPAAPEVATPAATETGTPVAPEATDTPAAPEASDVATAGDVATATMQTTSPVARPASRIERRPAGSGRGGWWQLLLAAVLGAVLALGGVALLDRSGETPTTSGSDETAAPESWGVTTAPVRDDSDSAGEVPAGTAVDAVAVGEKVIPSIVTVDVLAGDNVIASGSGVIVSDDGYVVTNNHVVAVGGNFRAVLSDGRTTYAADLVGTDPLTDLAVLKIDATGLTPIELGSTTDLTVGEPAVAVGSPLGLQGGPSLTVGVLSAFGRQVQTDASTILYGMLQTDAPITSGSSGGALVDGAGRLIGITTAVGVSQVGVEGIGFATPVEIVDRVVDELVADGSVQHALLGITGATTFDDAADGAEVAAGVMVESVNPGSAADDAGIVEGDVITAIDGADIETMEELIFALRLQRPGDQVTLTVDAPTTGPANVQLTLDAR
jgi:putative serine protease PepD